MALAIDAMTEAEAALAKFQQKNGRTIESLDDLLAGVKDGTIGWSAFGGILDEVALPTEDIIAWRQELDGAAHSAGLNTTSTDLLRAAMDDYIITQEQAGRDAARHRGNFRELGSGIKEVRTEADEATTALQRFEEEVRSQTDPLYGLMAAAEDVAEAQQAVIDAEDEHTKGSPEWKAAVRDLAQANEDLRLAQLKVAEQMGWTKDEFETHLRNMGGLTEEMISSIIEDFERVNAFAFKDHQVRVGVTGPAGWFRDIEERQHGGSAKRGVPIKVGEAGEEIFVPEEDGEIIPNHRIGRGTPIPTAAAPDLAGRRDEIISLLSLVRRLVDTNQQLLRQPIRLILDGREIAESIRNWERTWLPD
jgi:hypothetical protein